MIHFPGRDGAIAPSAPRSAAEREGVRLKLRVKLTQRASFSLSPLNGDLSRLGSGERNVGEATGPRGPNERERASHWVGVRGFASYSRAEIL
jgi:hypothetical protein